MSICCCCYLYLFTPPFLRTENYISRLISESIVKMSKMSCFDGIRTEMAAERAAVLAILRRTHVGTENEMSLYFR